MAKSKKSPSAAFLSRQSGEPICFDRGVILGHDQDFPFGGVPDRTAIDPNDGTDADLWVVDPSEWDEVLVVVVADERCTRQASFERWLRYETAVPPEDSPFARLFVPERAAGQSSVAKRVQQWLEEAGIVAEAVSYLPPYGW